MAGGALLIVLSWLIGIAGRGIGATGSLGLVSAIAVLVVVYLKYAPNQNINWPAPVPTILMILSGIVAVVALLQLIELLGVIGIIAQYGGIVTILSLVAYFVGAAMMGWGAYQEWQTSKSAA
jgi:hypothetical protein